MAVINVISNLGPLASVGLERDYLILRDILSPLGHVVRPIDEYSAPVPPHESQADINIYLESVHDPRYLSGYAKVNLLIPNPEWYFPQWDQYLPQFSLILCKTRHAQRLWGFKVGAERARYIGFESRDMKADSIVRNSNGWLHVAGKSMLKGTAAVVGAWKKYRLPYPLTVITCARTRDEESVTAGLKTLCNTAGNLAVRHLHNVSDEVMTTEMNRNPYYIGVSEAEGFGHCLHEAMSAGMVLVTTDSPPMNEITGLTREQLVTVERKVPRLMTELAMVGADGVAVAVERAMKWSPEHRHYLGTMSRENWLMDRERFRKEITGVVENWWSLL